MTYSEREFGASQSDYDPKEQKMSDIVERLEERTKIRWMGDCKCGHCQLVNEDDLFEVIAELKRLRAGRAAVVEECAKVAECGALNFDDIRSSSSLRSIAEAVCNLNAARIRALKGGAA
jgi:hypothetical protein